MMMMAHPPEDGEADFSTHEFIEEHWILFLFGGFFLCTMFLPMLFLDNKGWMGWGLGITLCIVIGLLVYTLFIHKHVRKI